MTEGIHLQCRVEKINGELVVRIALEDGCDEFIECSKGASRLEGDDLINIIPEFISETLHIEEGSIVRVSNVYGCIGLQPLTPVRLQ